VVQRQARRKMRIVVQRIGTLLMARLRREAFVARR
jgi:hypothetical protein